MIKGIHFARNPVKRVPTGMFCTVNLKTIKKKDELSKNNLRKGIVLLSEESMTNPVIGFEA